VTLTGSDPYGWLRLIRRARLGSSVKLVAFVLASYANPDGTSVRPGNPRLVAVTELSDKTVRTSLAKLRSLGLLERVREGSKCGRKKLADEYRLTIPDNAIEVLELLPVKELPGELETLPEASSPVTTTGDEAPEPVDNSASPVTSTGDEPPEEPPEPKNTGNQYRGSPGTPVTGSKNTGNGYRPPTQRPTQVKQERPTNKHDTSQDHGAEVEVRAPAPATRETKKLQTNGDTADCAECGALLDPDGSCFVCRIPIRRGIPA